MTTVSPSTSTSTFTFPRPVSPSKDNLKPNAHPYPIKTTSTALLSRSNSSPHGNPDVSAAGRHNYVPSSPSPKNKGGERTGMMARGGRHRYSRSLTDEDPRPLPIPPSRSPSRSPTRSPQDNIFPIGRQEVQQNTYPGNKPFARPTIDPFTDFVGPSMGVVSPIAPPSRKSKRADTLPFSVSLPEPTVSPLEILPPNPKEWSPAQLSTYLSTALRFKSNNGTTGGETLVQVPPRVVDDIAAFVRNKRINGRRFLRWDEDDLEGYVCHPFCLTLSFVSFQSPSDPLT